MNRFMEGFSSIFDMYIPTDLYFLGELIGCTILILSIVIIAFLIIGGGYLIFSKIIQNKGYTA